MRMDIIILVIMVLQSPIIAYLRANALSNNSYTKGNDGNHYRYIGYELKWIDANKKCNEEGAHLAIDDSVIVHDYLINTYHSLQFWIGINELSSEGTWRYNDGRKVLKSYWDVKQPENLKKNDDCAAMGKSGKWLNDACTLKKSFLCQIREIPEGYTRGLDGNYYKYYSKEGKWHDANIRCFDDGAHLPVVDSDDVHKVLIKNYPSLVYWLGVNDLSIKGKWMFTDGRSITKGYWEFGQPEKERGNCVVMWNSNQWHVVDCSSRRPFLCQITSSGNHLRELMNKRIQNNPFTAPAILGVIVLVIFLFVIWCIFKHKRTRKIPNENCNKPKNTLNQQPRYVINLNDTITINPSGSKSISTIHKSVVFASDTTIQHYPIYNIEDRMEIPQTFDNHGHINQGFSLPSSFYSMAPPIS